MIENYSDFRAKWLKIFLTVCGGMIKKVVATLLNLPYKVRYGEKSEKIEVWPDTFCYIEDSKFYYKSTNFHWSTVLSQDNCDITVISIYSNCIAIKNIHTIILLWYTVHVLVT